MSTAIQFDPIRLPPETETLRAEVRAFLKEEIAAGVFNPNSVDGKSFNREFARRVAAKGWIGMTWPKKYGGQERSFLERYVVTEEF
ncbi:MAG: acyl-CoA dehydrogenase family protein, partial [Alphaproteobacteria bacterium]|nr:acyl-CoA dehydrogenase family protein [Alphaproteobacteria bacterium]